MQERKAEPAVVLAPCCVLDRHQTIIGGYSHFWPGTFIRQSGAHKDIDFAYLGWQFTF